MDTRELMNFVKGKKMEESDMCMFLENLGVVLDRATWEHFKEIYAQSHDEQQKGKIMLIKNSINVGFIA